MRILKTNKNSAKSNKKCDSSNSFQDKGLAIGEENTQNERTCKHGK